MQGTEKISKKQMVETGIVFALATIFSFLAFQFKPGLWIACVFLLVSILFPVLLFPLAWCWFGLSKILSWLMSRIILSIVFYIMVTPVGLVRKLAGKDNLKLKQFKKNNESVFTDRNHKYSSTDLKYPF
ncbi:MAG: SxtJ family membrane protein [Bacteroidales bacterium]